MTEMQAAYRVVPTMPTAPISLPDRLMIDAVYRAMKMVAAAIRARFGVTIHIEIDRF